MRFFIISLAFLSILLYFSCNQSSIPVQEKDFSAYLALPLEERQSAAHAADPLKVATGLEVNAFATEPMVINPTNMTIDHKGRVWVCESYNYAVPEEEQKEVGGRIIILSDENGDGKVENRKVFYQDQDVHLALGISVFGNKVYVSRSPHLFVFTDDNEDDIPDQIDTLFTGMGNPGDHSAHAVVFGPDGRYYFNYGNAGNKVMASNGEIMLDQFGKEVRSNGSPYHGGMAFRFEEGGKNFEVLGHNFRNNYELAIDSYGNLWQSDNDDDGYRGVRINYIMEGGNFGYLDEYTGAHWTKARTGMNDSIPMRHWHQNDPGVVPNILLTGAGSPAGITVYEGDLLPEKFSNQIVHADAGPNVVRAYPTQASGAGFIATIANIVNSEHDQWFRPVDVATGPDGSLFIADWYDPIVGGGAAGDHQKGRIFRVAPPGSAYQWEKPDFSTLMGATEALKSPNESIRFLAWQQIHQAGDEAEEHLLKLWQSKSPHIRARALWLLGQMPSKGTSYINTAIEDSDPRMRIIGIRLARQLKKDMLAIVERLVQDPDVSVRRELAIALRYEKGETAANLWATLAMQYHGEDRWYLEALGIGASNQWEVCFDTWLGRSKEQWKSAGGKEIIWRARTPNALPYLSQLISNPTTSPSERLKYFRAFDFHLSKEKNKHLLSLLEIDHPEKSTIQSLALQHLDPEGITLTPTLSSVLDNTLNDIKGSWQFVDLIDRFNLTNKNQALLELGTSSFENDAADKAIRLLLTPDRFKGAPLVKQRIYENEEDGKALIHAMRSISTKTSLDLLKDIILDKMASSELKKQAIQAIGKTWWGEEYLLETVKDQAFPEDLKPVAARILFSVYRTAIHEEAGKYLERPNSIEGDPLPPLRDLVATVGNAARGQELFNTQCKTCHVVNGEGINFGPELSLIGDKLSKEGLYRSIIYPNEGINYNFEAFQLTLKSGGVAVGILTNETDEEIEIKLVGGATQSYKSNDILEKEKYPSSLMPNLSLGMSKEQLVDLVTYLSTLKTSEKAI